MFDRYNPNLLTTSKDFRELRSGEMMRVGDIYFNNGKWYRIGDTVQLGPYNSEQRGICARRVDGKDVWEKSTNG
jgi:hypothetical protein